MTKGKREITTRGKEPKTRSGGPIALVAILLAMVLLVGAGLIAKWYFDQQPAQSAVQEEPEASDPPEPETAEESQEPEESVEPEESEASEETNASDPSGEEDWELLLVNRWNAIPDGYTVDELVTLSNGYQVDARIYPYLQEMFNEMRAEGVYPEVASGYRTHERQIEIINEKIESYLEAGDGLDLDGATAEAELWVAVPGTSEHETGLAVDINADGIHSYGTEVYSWLAEHAWEYGFILRYPEGKEDITATDYEPWHYRYVGKENAKLIQESGLTLEEYLGNTDQSDPIVYTYSGDQYADLVVSGQAAGTAHAN